MIEFLGVPSIITISQCQSWVEQGDFNQAIQGLLKLLSAEPDNLESRYLLANCYFQIESYFDAREHFEFLYARLPDNANVVDALWKTYYLMGDYQTAIGFYQQARNFLAQDYAFYYQLARCYENQGEVNHAIAAYEQALQLNMTVEALLGYADQLKSALRLTDAIDAFQKTVSLQPDEPSHYINVGTVYSMLGENTKAIECFMQAYRLEPNFPTLANKVTHVYLNNHQGEQALDFIDKLLESNPNEPELLFCRGEIDKIYYKDDLSAGQYYKQACQSLIQSYHEGNHTVISLCSLAEKDAITYYFNECLDTCDWDEIDRVLPIVKAILIDGIEQKTPIPFNPTVLHVIFPEPNQQKKMLSALSEQYNVGKYQRFPKKQTLSLPLRIGYLSPDFNQHVVGFIIQNFIHHHNRELVHVSCYALSDITDQVTESIKEASDSFKSLVGFSHLEAAQVIHNDGIDILIDLAGYTENSQTQILSYYPAPIQAHFLGYSGTMGADFFDYYMTHEVNSPSALRPWFDESLAYLPETLTAVSPIMTDNTPKREDFGLSEEQIVFAAFSVGYRINRHIFMQWLMIIQQVPNSVLWLNSLSQPLMEHLRNAALLAGVEPSRLIFRSEFTLQTHWEIQLADVYLDTSPLSGMTATIYALWFGVPVVTLTQLAYHSNFSATCLHAFGLSELIANSETEYQNIAIELGVNQEKRKALHQLILQLRNEVTLYQPKRFIKQVEKLYLEMAEDYKKGVKRNPLYS